jgi:SAM-dependent methyltransferase
MTLKSDNDLEIVDRIPLSAKRILNVGCGSGILGAEYKRRNPMATVFGIEASSSAAEQARCRLDCVYVSDVEVDPIPFVGDVASGSLDCIIYGPDTECFDGFWEIVKIHISFLSDSGVVIFCTENLEHWRFVESVINGTWSDQDENAIGLSRCRYMTPRDVERQLCSIGLISADSAPRGFDLPACQAFVDKLSPGLTNLGVDSASYGRRAAPRQHVWRAQRRSAAERLTIVSTMLNPVGGVSDVRVVEPMRALAADPGFATMVIANADAPPSDVTGPRIMILHRPLLAGGDGLEKVRRLLEGGWVVVCEFDDHPDYIPVLQRPDIQNFRAVHAVQTSTQALANVLRRYNPEVAVFENAIDKLPDIKNFTTADQITLLFAGLNREADWPAYIETLNEVTSRFASRLHYEIINDRALFEALRTEKKNFTPLCDYEVYREILSQSEISFMPLSDTPFNRCKSDLKYIEAAAHRVAVLASNVVYDGSIEDGRTGLLFGTPAELGNCLASLVGDLDAARGIGDAGRQYVQDSRMLVHQLSKRAAWYRSLWARRDALTRSLLARVPELRS